MKESRKDAKSERSHAAKLCAFATLRESPVHPTMPQIDLKVMQYFSQNYWEKSIFATSMGPQEAFTVAKIVISESRRIYAVA